LLLDIFSYNNITTFLLPCKIVTQLANTFIFAE